MDLVHNERRKYLAAAFDRASTACLALGVFGQIVQSRALSVSWQSITEVGIWIVGAVMLHVAGRWVLGGLR